MDSRTLTNHAADAVIELAILAEEYVKVHNLVVEAETQLADLHAKRSDLETRITSLRSSLGWLFAPPTETITPPPAQRRPRTSGAIYFVKAKNKWNAVATAMIKNKRCRKSFLATSREEAEAALPRLRDALVNDVHDLKKRPQTPEMLAHMARMREILAQKRAQQKLNA